MAEGDLTKERTLNKIEIVSDWVIQIREIDGVYEEQKDMLQPNAKRQKTESADETNKAILRHYFEKLI